MGEIGLSDNEISVDKTGKPLEQVAQTSSPSKISRLKDLLGKIKTRRVRNNNVSESGTVGNSEDTRQEVEIEQPESTLEQKTAPETSQPEQNAVEISDVEPIKQETIEEICKVMAKIPTLGEDYGHDIPYRTERRAQTDDVFDEETGLYLQASYIPSKSSNFPLSQLRSSPGLTIFLSTSPLVGEEAISVSLGKMDEALRRIYGDSEELGKRMGAMRYWVRDDNQYDRVKFEFTYDKKTAYDKERIRNGFSAVSGQDRPINQWDPPKEPILETGGQFLKAIVERAAQKQIEESEENKQQTQQVIDKVKDEIVPNDESKVYEFAYHATDRRNIPSISQNGLQPSRERSKEPGTIFVTNWDSATMYLPKGEEGALYRFKVKDIPKVAESWYYDDVKGFHDMVTATTLAIGAKHLDFSLDGGETWMPAISRKAKQAD